MKGWRWFWLAALLVARALAVAGCGSDDDEAGGGGTTAAATTGEAAECDTMDERHAPAQVGHAGAVRRLLRGRTSRATTRTSAST